MPELPVMATSKHRFVTARAEQIRLNLLALEGGRPYIDERLSRFPAESAIDWAGTILSRSQGGLLPQDRVAHGRKDRAYLINHCARIVYKINQYVFQVAPKREGADPDFQLDASKTGMTLDEVMERVSELLSANRWCWIMVDMPRTDGQPMSAARAAELKIRPYWCVYTADEVVDWEYDNSGNLLFAIIETKEFTRESPNSAVIERRKRRVIEARQITELTFNKAGDAIEKTDVIPITCPVPPIVCVGIPSSKPWWFDDCEMVMRSLMDLESAHDTAMFDAVYPQLVLPAGLIEYVMNKAAVTFREAVEMVRGLNNPIFEKAEDRGTTRYVTPPAADLMQMRTEMQARKRELYEIVGLALQFEGKAVESADAKEWRNLDPKAVLRSRAHKLEMGEAKAVEISKLYSPLFQSYTPKYNRDFDITDMAEQFAGLLDLQQIDMTPTMKKIYARLTLDSMAKLGPQVVTQEDRDKVLQEIEDGQFESIVPEPPDPLNNPPEPA